MNYSCAFDRQGFTDTDLHASIIFVFVFSACSYVTVNDADDHNDVTNNYDGW